MNVHNVLRERAAVDSDLIRWMRSEMRPRADETSALQRISQHLAERSVLVPLLRGILRHKDILTEVSDRSYQHDNGFDKIVLFASSKPEFAVRLHIWKRQSQTPEGNIHNHRWNFSSMILLGMLRVEEFTLRRGISMVDSIYKNPNGSDQYMLQPMRRVGLRLVRSMTFEAGDNYSCNYRILHRAVAESDAVTLVVTGARQQPETRVITAAAAPHPASTPFRYLTTRSVQGRLKGVIELLQASK